MTESAVLKRFDSVYAAVEKAAAVAGRKAGEVTLIAVSKKHHAERVAALAEYWARFGQPAFGENYMQEALAKKNAVADLLAAKGISTPLHWHFIGHIQSKKSKDIAGEFDLIHTISSEKLAQAMDKAWHSRVLTRPVGLGEPASEPQRVLIQVNIGREEQKSGVMPEEVEALVQTIVALPGLRLEGMMCIPPVVENAEAARPYFAAMRELADQARHDTGLALPHLSMGMSGDFTVAIEEGATFVRIGTDIFGERL